MRARALRWGAAFLLLCVAAPLAAEDKAAALARVMMLDAAAVVMRDEGLALGAEMDRDVLGGNGGNFWTNRIAKLYDEKRIVRHVAGALAEGLSEAQVAEVTAFFDTPRGRRILTLETDARRAMIDDDIEQVARQTYEDLRGSDDPRLALISEFIEVNDLLERNVAGALSSDYRFTRGMVEGGALAMSDGDILSEVWEREDEVREDTASWLYGFLLLAYGPLSDDDLADYIAFSETPAGQALNAALFDGFESYFADISFMLGFSVALAMQGSDL